MTSANVNTITNIIGDYKNKIHIPINLPLGAYDDNEKSYGKKKSRRYLFNKRGVVSPSLESSKNIQVKTPKQLINLYNSLSSDQKKDIKILLKEANKVLKIPNTNKPDNSGITNIMMIMVLAFCQNMNTESMDMLAQIQETTLTNYFLQKAQQILQTNMKNNENLLKTQNKSGGKAGFKAMIAIIVICIVVAIVAPELMPEAAEDTPEAGANTEETVTDTATNTEETATTTSDNIVEDEEKEITTNTEDETAPTEDSVQTEEERVNKIYDETLFKERGGDIEDTFQGVDDKFDETWEKTEDYRKRVAKAFKDNGGFGKKFIYRIGSRAIKYGMYGAGAAGGGFMIMNQFWPDQVPHGANLPNSPKVQEQLSTYQMVAQYETGVININNNIQQTTSKRMSDDAQRITQSSGYVQQAIQMFGQAYSFRA